VSYHFNWPAVWAYAPQFATALGISLALSAACLFLGSLLGMVLAFVSTGGSRVGASLVRVYVEVLRNVPILLWTYFAFYGLPDLGIHFLNNVSAFVVALSLYAASYLTEVFRSGLQSIPARFHEAARALGLSRIQRTRLVVLPLMFRITLPALSNTFISLFKDTSIASAISVPEITFTAQYVDTTTFRVIETWTLAALLYVVVTYLLAAALRSAERRLSVGV
jgi:polar amino acid transport system permease protein